MGGSFSVEPGSLREGGRSFTSIGDRLDEAVGRLRAAMAEAGEPWGHDGPGRSFERGYRDSAHGAYARLASLPRAVHLVAGGLERMADEYEVADAASAVGP